MIKSKSEIKNKEYLLIVVIAVSYGIIIEVLQGVLTDTRKPDFNDVIANTTGVVIAVLLNKYISKWISFRKFKI